MDLRVYLVPKEPPTKASRRELAMWALEVLPLVEGVDKRELARWAAVEVGMDPRVVARFIHTDAEMQQQQMAALQQQAVEQEAADGGGVNPAAVPGPMSGDDLAAAVNAGELPPEASAAPDVEYSGSVEYPIA